MSLIPHRTLPVLMYHRFGTEIVGDSELWISPATFARQLGWLRDHGYRTLTLDEAFAAWCSGSPPQRTVLLTIDDGFADDLDRAREVLVEHDARATVFVPAGLVGQEVELSHPAGAEQMISPGRLADRAELEGWLGAGFDLGSHGLGHLDLTTASPDTMRGEIQDSKARLEDLLHRPIHDFCYPFAHHDQPVRQAVAEAGYRSAYAGEPPIDDRYAIPRMMIYPRDDLARFRRKVSGYYYWISALHQQLRRFVRN